MLKSIKLLLALAILGQFAAVQTTGKLVSYGNGSDAGVADAFYQYAAGDITTKKTKSADKEFGVSGSAYTQPIFLPTALY